MPHPNTVNPLTGKRYAWEEEQRKKQEADPEFQREQLAKEIQLLERQEAAVRARDDLLAFTKFTMPDAEDPNDVKKSAYRDQAFHRKVAHILTLFEKGELKHADGTPCSQVIFAMPPRHGKTELATKRNTAWISGRHPEWNIAVGSYSDTMAQDFGADTRAILASPQFRQVFPDHKLKRGGNAKDNMQSEKGGRLVFVGRGGALTGRGAHCFPGYCEVQTRKGPKSIKDILVGEEVLSYDIDGERPVWKRVEAVTERPRSRLYRVSDNAGRVVDTTGDHRFFTRDGWKEAVELTPGDRLVCAVRQTLDTTGRRRKEALHTGPDGLLLQQRVLGESGELEAARRASLFEVRQPRASENLVRIPETRPDLLLENLPGDRAAGGTGTEGAGADAPVSAVQFDVRTELRGAEILLPGLRGQGTFRGYARREQPYVEKRGERAEVETPRREAVPGTAASCLEARWAQMRGVRVEEAARSAPHRRERAQQQSNQSCNALPEMPREGPFWASEEALVGDVVDLRRDAVVYDIQVEETHNFFVNGVLVSNCLLIDDLYKDHEEARSQTIRDQAWNWFTKVAMTRRMGRKLVMITMTRWHSDDIVGRITDPENPCYDAVEAKKWMIIRIPAIAEEDDPLGREEGEALWPEDYGLDFLQSQQRLDPLGFAALYQQRPTVADGVLFRRENIQRYDPSDLPEDLRFYAASDHAVATGQRNDYSCFGKVGVDRQDNIWLVDLFRQKVTSDVAVEAMLTMGGGNMRPLLWWAERGHISKSIGPFLYKRMEETGVYMNVVEVTPIGDKEQRAQSIAARVAMGKVFIPKGHQYEWLVEEMLAFPNGIHDDGVDMLSLLGLGLQSQFGASTPKQKPPEPKFGTIEWVKQQEKMAAQHRGGAEVW